MKDGSCRMGRRRARPSSDIYWKCRPKLARTPASASFICARVAAGPDPSGCWLKKYGRKSGLAQVHFAARPASLFRSHLSVAARTCAWLAGVAWSQDIATTQIYTHVDQGDWNRFTRSIIPAVSGARSTLAVVMASAMAPAGLQAERDEDVPQPLERHASRNSGVNINGKFR